MQSVEQATPDVAMTTPGGFGDTPLPKRNGARGMLPSTWLGRSCRLSYLDAHGSGVETTGQLLDYCGAGPVFNLAGARTLVSWDRLAMLELAGD